jgi:multicomponent Na+:H+ antiporter subunit E
MADSNSRRPRASGDPVARANDAGFPPARERQANPAPPTRALLLRATGYYAFWVVLIGTGASDLAFGLCAAVAAAWVSLRVLPAGSLRLRPRALVTLVPHFLWQSVVAGWDVARRVFDPRLPIKPGLLRYPVGFAPGAARNAYAGMTSLLPGTVPCGEEDGAIVYHCLDTDQPLAAQLAAEERRLARVLVAPDRSADDD